MAELRWSAEGGRRVGRARGPLRTAGLRLALVWRPSALGAGSAQPDSLAVAPPLSDVLECVTGLPDRGVLFTRPACSDVDFFRRIYFATMFSLS